jgi:hypothetical protein
LRGKCSIPTFHLFLKIKIIYIKIKGVVEIKLEGVMYGRQSILKNVRGEKEDGMYDFLLFGTL